jgi:hypothetical protein
MNLPNPGSFIVDVVRVASTTHDLGRVETFFDVSEKASTELEFLTIIFIHRPTIFSNASGSRGSSYVISTTIVFMLCLRPDPSIPHRENIPVTFKGRVLARVARKV